MSELVQGSAERRSQSLVNFIAAAAYHFWMSWTTAFTNPVTHLSAELFSSQVLKLSLNLFLIPECLLSCTPAESHRQGDRHGAQGSDQLTDVTRF